MKYISRCLSIAALLTFGTHAYADGSSASAASASPPVSTAQPDSAVSASATDPKLDIAIKLVKASGGYDAMTSSIDDSIDSTIAEQKKAHPEVSEAFWDEFKLEFKDYLVAHRDDLLRLVAQVYVAHLSESELKEAVAFYETGPGKKLNDPAIPAEAQKAGEAWGSQVGSMISEQVMKKLQASAKG
jgi:hypothetical protein